MTPLKCVVEVQHENGKHALCVDFCFWSNYKSTFSLIVLSITPTKSVFVYIKNMALSLFRGNGRCNMKRAFSSMAVPKVLIPIANGFDAIDVVSVQDVLIRAGADITIMSIYKDVESPVASSTAVKLFPQKTVADCASQSWDMIVLPGGEEGSKLFHDCQPLTQLLHSQFFLKKYIAAIGTAPALVLAPHELLFNKCATCYPFDRFTTKLKHHADVNVVVDDHMITSKGPGTALQFALVLAEKLFDKEKSKSVAKEILYNVEFKTKVV